MVFWYSVSGLRYRVSSSRKIANAKSLSHSETALRNASQLEQQMKKIKRITTYWQTKEFFLVINSTKKNNQISKIHNFLVFGLCASSLPFPSSGRISFLNKIHNS